MASSNLDIVYGKSSVTMRLPSGCIKDCTHMGSCDADVEHWTKIFRSQLETIPQDVIQRAGRNVKLTNREKEILRELATEKSPADIADFLFISKRTVDFHTANIYDKLGVDNRFAAFRVGLSLGLV